MIFLDIPSSYAKILRETNFHAWEISPSVWKAEGVEKRRNTPRPNAGRAEKKRKNQTVFRKKKKN